MKTLAEVRVVYDLPLPELILRAAEVHRAHHDFRDIQRCALLSIKTGGCPEDCGYCSQSARYDTAVRPEPMLSVEEVAERAARAKALGATRFCMGAAWRKVPDGPAFERVLEMVRAVRAQGMEACVTLGMLTDEQARRLRDAGLTAYNHNLDTSRRHYGQIVSTRTYEDRLETLRAVGRAGIAVCCGGILGMGETEEDRLMLLVELSALDPPPESIPINCLVPIVGTPLESAPPVDSFQLVRLVATTRITFPPARVRLSAGRDGLSRELQLLCFLAGANSIFFGEKLLTAPNPTAGADAELFRALGLPISVGSETPPSPPLRGRGAAGEGNCTAGIPAGKNAGGTTLLPSPPLGGRGAGGEGAKAAGDSTPSPQPLSPEDGGEGLALTAPNQP